VSCPAKDRIVTRFRCPLHLIKKQRSLFQEALDKFGEALGVLADEVEEIEESFAVNAHLRSAPL
jgi:hypothetical protein